MGKLQRLTGSPWHVEKMVREDGDERRHRSRCIYYRGKADSYCGYFCGKCRGAAHCEHYKEHAIDELEIIEKIDKPIVQQVCTPFEGIKTLKIRDITVPDKFKDTIPKESKIKELETFIKANGRLDKPIAVSCDMNSYEVADKYLRYYVAKKLGLKEVPAEMGSKEELKIYDQLRTLGTLIWIKKSAEIGEVIGFDLERVKLRLDSGKETSYDIHKGISSGSIRIL